MAQLSEAFAEYASNILNQTLEEKKFASLVVPGGGTPRRFLPVLAKCPLPWERITITLSDERWVDTNDEQSNEKMVRKYLLENLPANTNFISLKTHHNDPFTAVKEVNQRLDKLPQPLNLTIVGLGEDGHIASLFPGMHFDLLSTQHCVGVAPPIAPSPRISLSLPMLVKSEHIALVVVGEIKQHLLNQLSKDSHLELPIQWLLQRTHSQIDIFETKE